MALHSILTAAAIIEGPPAEIKRDRRYDRSNRKRESGNDGQGLAGRNPTLVALSEGRGNRADTQCRSSALKEPGDDERW